MPRPDFIQAPTAFQQGAVFALLRLNRRLVAGRYGDLLPPDLALEFREAIGTCERLFELEGIGTANDNDTREQAAVREAINAEGL